MTKLTEIEQLAAASDPSGQAIVAGMKGPEGEQHFIMHVDAARRFVTALMNALDQAEANRGDADADQIRGPLLPVSQWTVMPSQPEPEQLVLQMQGAGLITNYPLAPADARALAQGLWAGADRTDGGAAAQGGTQ